jgi:hypothetical protein
MGEQHLEMLDTLRQAGHTAEVQTYENLSQLLQTAKTANFPGTSKLEEELGKTVNRWFDSGLIKVKNELPECLTRLIQARSTFSSRYDPFVLAVEHECLRRTKLERTVGTGERRPYVRFVALDKELAPKDEALKARQEEETCDYLSRLGTR